MLFDFGRSKAATMSIIGRVKDLYFRLGNAFRRVMLYVIYTRLYIPIKVRRIRKKPRIKVLFVVGWLGFWKSQLLYDAMVKHPRFEPIILVAPGLSGDQTDAVAAYFKEKNIGYFRAYANKPFSIKETINPDIIFYPQTYPDLFKEDIYYRKNLYALFCYVNYGLRGVDIPDIRNTFLLNIVWQNYFENEITLKGSARLMLNKGRNGIVTGLPFQNEYFQPKEEIPNPWKPQRKSKKKVIWAPHHSINQRGLKIEYATFFQYADIMKELVRKYADEVQWAFKPHPVLYFKLCSVWGREKTDEYYDFWRKQDNTQLEEGQYLGLFMHSDAMIHDCGSFTIEYQYSGSPALYLVRNEANQDDFNEFHRRAYDIHYKGFSADDIEVFIQNVINGIDPKLQERSDFVKEYLTPPGCGDASINIVNSILGKYKDA